MRYNSFEVTPMSELGGYLKKIRNEKKLSMKAVKAETDISDSSLSHIESGKTEYPNPHCLKKLAKIYQIDLVDLYIKAGYLDCDDLSCYQQCFIGLEHLSDEERNAIQGVIGVMVKKMERCVNDDL